MPLPARRVLRTFRYAMYFNGVNAYVLVPDSASLRITNEITLVATVYPLDTINWHAVATGKLYTYFLAINNNTIRFYLGDGSSWFLLAGYFQAGWPSIPAGSFAWQNIIASYTSSNGSYKVFVNGGLIASGSVTPKIIGLNDKGVSIGAVYPPSPYTYWFSGYISQLLIYSRALLDSEIAWNYSNPDNPVRNGLVLWLQAHPDYVKDIDGDGIPEWIDLSGYGNHGKIYGAQLVQLVKTPNRNLAPVRVLPVAR